MAGGASLSSSLHLNLRRRSSTIVSVASPADTQTSSRVQLPHKTRNSRVLVLGGTGRVGGSTAIALSNLCPDLHIIVAGRNRYEIYDHLVMSILVLALDFPNRTVCCWCNFTSCYVSLFKDILCFKKKRRDILFLFGETSLKSHCIILIGESSN